MNRKLGAIVGAIIGVSVAGIVVLSGIGIQSSEGLEPTASAVALATPNATVQATTQPTPVATVRPTAMPAPVATVAPSVSPVTVATTSPQTAVAASTASVPSTVRLPKLTARVAGATKIKYFGVKGDSPYALIDNVVQRSKAGCKSSDTLACVSQRWNVRWTERTVFATGTCTIVATQVSLTSTVHLPRWESPKSVQPALLTWWKKMADHMAWHEGQHIKIQKAHDAKLAKLMNGHSCSSAGKIQKHWKRDLRAAQNKFDAKDMLWPYPEYTGPGGWYGI